MSKTAVILVRGKAGMKGEIEDTLDMLNLFRKNFCVIIPANPSMMGMVKHVKDFVTWGEIDDATEKMLIEKRGEKDKPFFRLQPPRGGFGRKGIKIPFNIGGGIGYRGPKINDLIRRML